MPQVPFFECAVDSGKTPGGGPGTLTLGLHPAIPLGFLGATAGLIAGLVVDQLRLVSLRGYFRPFLSFLFLSPTLTHVRSHVF